MKETLVTASNFEIEDNEDDEDNKAAEDDERRWGKRSMRE